MILTRHPLILALAFAGVYAPTVSAVDDVFRKPDASCILRISYDGLLVPLSRESIEALLNSDGPRTRALQAVELSPETDFFVSVVGLGEAERSALMVQANLTLAEQGERAAAQKVLQALCAELKRSLAELGQHDAEQTQSRLKAAQERLEQMQMEMQHLREMGRAISEAAGRVSLNRDAIAGEIDHLENVQHEMETEMLAMRAREDAIAKQITQVRERMDQSVDDDEVLQELGQILKFREQEAARLNQLREQQMVSEGEAAGALEQMAETRARIAERRETLRRDRGGELIRALNERLMDTAMSSAELVARLSEAQSRLDEIRKRDLLTLADKYQTDVASRLAQLGDPFWTLQDEAWRLESQLRDVRPPQVMVVGE